MFLEIQVAPPAHREHFLSVWIIVNACVYVSVCACMYMDSDDVVKLHVPCNSLVQDPAPFANPTQKLLAENRLLALVARHHANIFLRRQVRSWCNPRLRKCNRQFIV